MIKEFQSAGASVCGDRQKIAELGDTEVLEQLNSICRILQIAEYFTETTWGMSDAVTSKFLTTKSQDLLSLEFKNKPLPASPTRGLSANRGKSFLGNLSDEVAQQARSAK
jgi:hypothetical protein